VNEIKFEAAGVLGLGFMGAMVQPPFDAYPTTARRPPATAAGLRAGELRSRFVE